MVILRLLLIQKIRVVTYTYNSIGWKTSETSPKSQEATEWYTTSYDYDENGNVEKVTETGNEIPVEGYVTRITYDNMNRKTKEVPANLYDPLDDSLATHTYSGDYGYRYTYYPSGLINTATDSCGNETSYTYDVYGNILAETNPGDGIYVYTYDMLDRVTSLSFQNNELAEAELLTEYTYSILENGDTKKTETKHLNETDVAITEYTYDFRGNLIKQENPDDSYTTTYYNLNGTVEYTKDGRGNKTYYA